jgi:hypothetical protein
MSPVDHTKLGPKGLQPHDLKIPPHQSRPRWRLWMGYPFEVSDEIYDAVFRLSYLHAVCWQMLHSGLHICRIGREMSFNLIRDLLCRALTVYFDGR